jgi:hypothetical protein
MTLDNTDPPGRQLHLSGTVLGPRLSGKVLGPRLSGAVLDAATIPFVLDSPHDVGSATEPVVQAAVNASLQVAAEAAMLAEALDHFVHVAIATLQDASNPDSLMYAGALLLAIAYVIYQRHQQRS